MPVRDRGGMFTINNPDDGTPIKELFKLNEGLLLIVTEKFTYGVQVADRIDPERTNPNLAPNFQQKLFDYGTTSDLLCRTLLHAKVMFRKEFQAIDVEQAKQLSFDAFSNLVSLEGASREFKAAEEAEIERVQALEQKDRSMTLPAVSNVRAHCKGFMQKADHSGEIFLFRSAEEAEIERVQALEQKDRSMTLPAVSNVRAHCKGFMQKADHSGEIFLF